MKWEIRIYSYSGGHRGTTVIDSAIDVVNKLPISTEKSARRYIEAFLLRPGEYYFIDNI